MHGSTRVSLHIWSFSSISFQTCNNNNIQLLFVRYVFIQHQDFIVLYLKMAALTLINVFINMPMLTWCIATYSSIPASICNTIYIICIMHIKLFHIPLIQRSEQIQKYMIMIRADMYAHSITNIFVVLSRILVIQKRTNFKNNKRIPPAMMIQLSTTYLEQYTYSVKTCTEPTLCQFDPTESVFSKRSAFQTSYTICTLQILVCNGQR